MSVSIVVGEKLGNYQDLLLLDVGKYCCGERVILCIVCLETSMFWSCQIRSLTTNIHWFDSSYFSKNFQVSWYDED